MNLNTKFRHSTTYFSSKRLSYWSKKGCTRFPWKSRAAFLTPIAKSFGTEIGCRVAELGIQVHGGMGYIEESGAAQYYRDVRVTAIYEGTNGIQAMAWMPFVPS